MAGIGVNEVVARTAVDSSPAGAPWTGPVPRHIAMIMDGNGRWAQRQGLPRVEGHLRGAETVRRMVEECARLGVEQLTLFCLSSENWKRPAEELEFLMQLLRQYLRQEQTELVRGNIRLSVIGDLARLPAETQTEIDAAVRHCATHSGIRLCLAVNYGARAEIVAAARRLAEEVGAGQRRADEIDEAAFASCLDTAGMPDPDLLIRTAGEMRVSNFLLWQISYSELWVTPCLWPDLQVADLHAALREFGQRERRFGGLSSGEPA